VTDIWQQFKDFINRGNIIELGVAFVLGIAFKTIVDAFAGDGKDNPGILGGLIGAVFGGEQPNFGDRGPVVNGSFVPIGAFVTALLNFLVVALVLFVVVKAYTRLRRQADEEAGPTEVELLTAIREELRRSNERADRTDSAAARLVHAGATAGDGDATDRSMAP
jgi:large conductance mechanosensitive channel